MSVTTLSDTKRYLMAVFDLRENLTLSVPHPSMICLTKGAVIFLEASVLPCFQTFT